MAYSELIKNFERIRDYMRQFYVYGFKSREEYDAKSARSYDNERRRIESWLGDNMSFRQNASGKCVFISVDSRAISTNPLYNAYKAKSFTPGDITFHFYILDLLADGSAHTINEILNSITDQYLYEFNSSNCLDDSTLRKKLKEYEALGILKSEKRGRELLYSRTDSDIDLSSWKNALAFYSEEAPLGVIGSFLMDKLEEKPDYYSFKHHYILNALDSQVLCDLLQAIGDKRSTELTIVSSRSSDVKKHTVFPSKIYISTQSGRQYLLCYHYLYKRPIVFRLDNIHAVKLAAIEKQPDKYIDYCDNFRQNLWGVAYGIEPSLDHIEMTVHVGDGEQHIVDRLEREKRCGRLEIVDDHSYRFVADVYDATELLPWLRTFIGRIESLECSNPYVTDTFYSDLNAMSAIYGGVADAV